jgi:signal transduction histidine kinase
MASERERRPAIVAVDDEPAVLAAVARDLRRRFGERYRVLRATSGAEALDMLRQLRTRGDQVALLIAGQRMPGMPGTDYLVHARTIVPEAKRVLLTAYADTEAAIAAINEVALDYCLLKPWDPPEEQLFPVVEDLFTTWEAGAALGAGGVRVIGHRFAKDSHDLRDFLARNRVPAHWLDVERDGEARELLRVAGVDGDRLPVASSRTARSSGARCAPCSSSASSRTAIEVVRDYDRSLPKLTVRGSELNRVWTNLLDNAIQALGERGTITIRTHRKGDCAGVDISDDGPGIPAEIRDRIFDSFFTTTESGHGTGLGLATARRIVVDRHDGSRTVDSQPGRTTFHVSLPFTQP